MAKKEQSFGIIPIRRQNGNVELFLVKSRNGSFWGFPKGHADNDEDAKAAAERELKEETNLCVVKYLSEEVIIERYRHTRDGEEMEKEVSYFLAEVQGEVNLQKKELLDGVWVPLKDAQMRVSYPSTKALLQKIYSWVKSDSVRIM